MSESALDDAPISLPPPTPATTPPLAPPTGSAATPGITLDGTAPRLAHDPPPPTPPSLGAPAATTHVATPTESNPYSLDGTAPRLASSAPIIAVRPEPDLMTMPARPSAPVPRPDTPSPPLVSPVLSSPTAPMLPTPSSRIDPPAQHATQSNGDDSRAVAMSPAMTDEPIHPMAHLMPAKPSAPSEASRRAAEQRASKKAKAKKVKIGVISGILVVTAVVGPPITRWVVDAVNDAGKTTTVVDPAE